jgi:hypothetical protein
MCRRYALQRERSGVDLGPDPHEVLPTAGGEPGGGSERASPAAVEPFRSRLGGLGAQLWAVELQLRHPVSGAELQLALPVEEEASVFEGALRALGVSAVQLA